MPEFLADSSLVERVVPSPNFDERQGGDPDMILLHYTGMQTADEALERLRDPVARVSSHYFVHENGNIVQMVPEAKRAWHAGVSSWGGETDINSRSIGIEIVNPGHDFGYPDFPIRQIAAVIALCRGIIARRAITRDRVLAHSDVAPARKQDPGEKFPWRLLAESGVGLWVEPVPITDWLSLVPGDTGDDRHRAAEGARRIRLWRAGLGRLRRDDQACRHRVPAPFPAGAGRRHGRHLDPRDAAQAARSAQRRRQARRESRD